jgi:hypothetical protein
MKVFVSGATTTVRKFWHEPVIGRLLVPLDGNRPDALPMEPLRWALDNGAFSHFDEVAFQNMMERFEIYTGCAFCAAPDVLGDAAATLALFPWWSGRIRRCGFPVALVAQDGLLSSQVPWGEIDALFIGGSTEFKEGSAARTLISYAKARGKWCHMGRVNSRRRLWYALDIGVDSIDGSGFSKWPAVRLPLVIRWIKEWECGSTKSSTASKAKDDGQGSLQSLFDFPAAA